MLAEIVCEDKGLFWQTADSHLALSIQHTGRTERLTRLEREPQDNPKFVETCI